MSSALVVGGTGPSGVNVVNGLLAREFDVCILHRGLHEVQFTGPVKHLHADPHFREAIETALSGLNFDLTICMYGRTRLIADLMRHRTDRFITVSGSFYEGWIDGSVFGSPQSALTKPSHRDVHYAPTRLPTRESDPTEATSRFAERVLETEAQVIEAHKRGDFSATIFRYPQVYGPRQPVPLEWSLVRRALDGRGVLILPDGGLSLQARLYGENASRAILAAVDNSEVSSGEIFNAADAEVLTYRDWASMVGEFLGHTFELVTVRYEDASPAYPYALNSWNAGHRILSIKKAVQLLGYAPVPVEVGLRETIKWYEHNPLERGGAEEKKLGDTFDYEFEDAILHHVGATSTIIEQLPRKHTFYTHSYDHPKNGP